MMNKRWNGKKDLQQCEKWAFSVTTMILETESWKLDVEKFDIARRRA